MNPSTPREINFLPDWYLRQRISRARTKRQFVLVMLMLVGMAALWLMTNEQRGQLVLYRNAIQQQAMAAENQLLEVNKLQNAKADLSQQVRLYQKLARPISFSQIDAAIGALTPDSIFLSDLNLAITSQTRTRVVKDESLPKGAKPATVSESYPVIRIELEGHAPTNVDIANYIGKLAGCNLFRNVKMVYSREGKIGNALTRQFQLNMEVMLDRTYRVESGEEVAHVDVD